MIGVETLAAAAAGVALAGARAHCEWLVVAARRDARLDAAAERDPLLLEHRADNAAVREARRELDASGTRVLGVAR